MRAAFAIAVVATCIGTLLAFPESRLYAIAVLTVVLVRIMLPALLKGDEPK